MKNDNIKKNYTMEPDDFFKGDDRIKKMISGLYLKLEFDQDWNIEIEDESIEDLEKEARYLGYNPKEEFDNLIKQLKANRIYFSGNVE